MAVLSTITELNSITRMLKLTTNAGETSVTILQRDQASGVLSSSYLSAYHLSLIADKVNQILPLIDVADLSLLAYLPQSFLQIADLTGIATPLGTVSAGVEYLNLVGFINLQPTYVIVQIPHSIAQLSSIAPL